MKFIRNFKRKYMKNWKIKVIIFLVIVISLGFPGMYQLGRLHSDNHWGGKVSNAYTSLTATRRTSSEAIAKAAKIAEEAKSAAKIATNKLMSKTAELTEALATIASQEALIEQYEAREQVNAIVLEVRDINVQLFKEVKVRISSQKEYPWAIGSTDWELNPNIFGNFAKISDELEVSYYYGAIGNEIKIENIDDEKVNISYSAKAIMNPPYRIHNRNLELNLGAKIMTNTGDDQIYQLVNNVGINQLSNIEDEFIKKLKSEYKNSEIPIYVNGVLLKDWTSENKYYKKRNIDSSYNIEIK